MFRILGALSVALVISGVGGVGTVPALVSPVCILVTYLREMLWFGASNKLEALWGLFAFLLVLASRARKAVNPFIAPDDILDVTISKTKTPCIWQERPFCLGLLRGVGKFREPVADDVEIEDDEWVRPDPPPRKDV